MDCRIKRTSEWAVRLLHELPYHEGATFLTLTYDEKHLPEKEIVLDDVPYVVRGTLKKIDLQNFMRRLKYGADRKYKYFAVGEYGTNGTERPHYHAIVFGLLPWEKNKVRDAWGSGLVDLGTVTSKSCKYVASYIQKKNYGDLADKTYGLKEPPFQLASQGIGLQYALDNAERLRKKGFVMFDGVQVGVPRFYQKKLEMTHRELREHAHRREEALRRELDAEGIRVIRPDHKEAMYEPHRLQAERNTHARCSLREKGPL